jgi:TatD DNase family protein
MIYNTHSHLQDAVFDDQREALIRDVQERGMKVLLVGYTPQMNRRAIELAQAYDCFVVAVGIHPNHAHDWESQMAQLRELATHDKVVAIGECGLDYHWESVDKATQRAAFVAQLKLAMELQLPIIVHMRKATEDTYDILSSTYQGPGVMHCYSGNAEFAQRFIELGLHLGIGGPVTYKNAAELQAIVQATPLQSLLVETDDPYLAPTPFRGQQNIVTHVQYVIEQIAAIKQLDVAAVIQATTNNALQVFGGET